MASTHFSFKIPRILEFFGLFCLMMKILWQEDLTCLQSMIYVVLTLMLVIIFFLISSLLDRYCTYLILFCKGKSPMILIAFLNYVGFNNVKRLSLQASLILLTPFGIIWIKFDLMMKGSSSKHTWVLFVLVLL